MNNDVLANMNFHLNDDWKVALKDVLKTYYFKKILLDLQEEYKHHIIFPDRQKIFSAFNTTPFHNVKVVILGQDPYHDENQANGLCFSVNKGEKIPPSLRNIYKELEADLGLKMPDHGELFPWAEQGVLLLNASLSVRAHQAASHKKLGWEKFTDAVIKNLSHQKEHLVFMLWGSHAQKKEVFIDSKKHLVLKAVHPSPLSAYRGFFGCKHFSKANQFLSENHLSPINWHIK